MGLVTIFNVMVNIFITVRILEMSQSGSPLSADNEHYNFCFTVHKIWRKQYFVARIVGHNDTIPILSVPPPLGTLTLVRRREDGCILVRQTRPPRIAPVEHTALASLHALEMYNRKWWQILMLELFVPTSHFYTFQPQNSTIVKWPILIIRAELPVNKCVVSYIKHESLRHWWLKRWEAVVILGPTRATAPRVRSSVWARLWPVSPVTEVSCSVIHQSDHCEATPSSSVMAASRDGACLLSVISYFNGALASAIAG